MLTFSESEKKSIEVFLAWGSIAYILGFITVMTHTARLGIPVIEILKPLYIWIGLPLAIVIFSLRWIARFALRRFSVFKSNFQSLKSKRDSLLQEIKESKSINEISDEEQFNKLIRTYKEFESLLDSLSIRFLLRPFKRWGEKSFTRFSAWILDPISSSTKNNRRAGYIDFYYYYMKAVVLGYRAILEVGEIINFVATLLLVPFACYLYIFFVYPEIPQSIGGGKPTSVILMINTENIPTRTQYTESIFLPNSDKESKVIQTAKVEILYSTSDQYYIRADAGPIIALDKDLIKGIIWNP